MAPPSPADSRSRRYDLVGVIELLTLCCLHDSEIQVRPVGASIKNSQAYVQLVGEVVHYVAHHIRLGGSSEAQNRWDGLISRSLSNEASDIPIVRPEVVPPL